MTKTNDPRLNKNLRQRNWALLIVLLALVGIFYGLAMVRMSGHGA
jgi:hypothetical protein